MHNLALQVLLLDFRNERSMCADGVSSVISATSHLLFVGVPELLLSSILVDCGPLLAPSILLQA